jgi:phage-related protein (TIGR01555 family)
MKITAKSLKGLQVLNGILKEQNLQIRNNLELKERVIGNSLSSISGPGFGQAALNPYMQTPITSFNPLLQNNIYAPLTIDWTILIYAFKTHGIIQALCEMPVLDSIRGGIEISAGEASADEVAEMQDIFDEKGVLDVIAEARIWTRLFGGGALIASTDQPLDQALDEKRLGKSKLIEFYACNRWELMAPWRTSKVYNFYGKNIDGSHVRTMIGKTAPYILRWQLAGWGMSELERFIEDFNTYIRVKNVIYELLYEAKVDIYKFKDFAAQILSAEAESKTNKRMQLMNQQKNYNSALLLDKEDEYDQKQITWSGLAEIYREARIELACAARMPMTKLFGLPSTSMASNEDDLEVYNNLVETEVRQPMRRDIKWALRLLSIALFGDDYNFDFEFKPLRTMSAKEEEEVKTSKFTRAMTLYQTGLIDEKALEDTLAKDNLIDDEMKLQEPPEPEVEEGAQEADEPERTFAGVGGSKKTDKSPRVKP